MTTRVKEPEEALVEERRDEDQGPLGATREEDVMGDASCGHEPCSHGHRGSCAEDMHSNECSDEDDCSAERRGDHCHDDGCFSDHDHEGACSREDHDGCHCHDHGNHEGRCCDGDDDGCCCDHDLDGCGCDNGHDDRDGCCCSSHDSCCCDDDGDGCHCDDREGCGCCDHDDQNCCCRDGDHDSCCSDDDGDGCCCDGHDGCCCDHDHGHQSFEEHALTAAPTFSYHVLGIDCPNCARTTQNAVRALECVADARLVYATATLEVVMSEDATSEHCRRHVLETVRSCGQDLELSEDEAIELEARRSWYAEHRETLLMGISGVALACGLAIDHLMGNDQAAIVPYVVAAIAGIVFVTPMALASLRRRTADMNVLMGIAVLGGLALGFSGDIEAFGDAAIVIFLDQVGEWLEGWSMRKTSGSIKELMQLAPEVAHVVTATGVEERAVSEVEEGERIRVLAGERVPLDGVIRRGSSSFNEAAITGESVPKDKGAGDEVFAGALNASGVVEIEVTADEDCTMLSRIVAMVQGAQAQKAPYESFVDRFASVYTPIVVACAVVVGLAVPCVLSLVSGLSAELWHDWIYRALSLLVVACPCALVISTPVSFVSAITRAAKNGVLVKGGAYFDIASRVTAVAFDKTGTLTTGNPQVVGIVVDDEIAEGDVLGVACSLEGSSTHPLARAVVEAGRATGIGAIEATSVEERAGFGVLGVVAGDACSIGKPSLAEEMGALSPQVEAGIEEFGARGATALVVTRAGKAIGVIGVADTLRPEVPQAMAELRSVAKVGSVEMLTGDVRQAAEAIAREAQMTHAVSELLPDGKVAYVRDLQASGECVAMVGDGINDAPALAVADLGIAMGAASSDTALEVADVALLGGDLTQLPRFLELSMRTMHIVSENIAFAILVKALVFVAVVCGAAGMGAAIFADTGVALIVIVNGMRLMIDSRLRW